MKFLLLFRFAIGLFSFVTLVVGLDEDDEPQCGYKSCPIGHPDRINVHLVSHSHDDTGWLKTVDQYYSGSYDSRYPADEWSRRAGVQYILDTVVRELAFEPNRKFIQVETAFFWRWWSEQEQQIKDLVTELVNSGQLEFISGGWCMNDEATAHYVAIIDQMSFGMKKLKDTFGSCGIPRTAWQIDPFGHSKEQADLFLNMGMDSLLFGRLDYREKSQRFENKTGEMVWLTSKGNENKLFTSILYDLYVSPAGFCWDASCTDEPLMDNPILHDYNIDVRSMEFVKFVRRQKESYSTNNILVTLGMDFNYQLAHLWFKNIDKLINYVNTELGEQEKIHLMYSTPSCYIKALNDEGAEWSTKNDDFFPYASDPHSYWTGFFSSRPTSKRFIREASGWLQFAKHLTSRAFINQLDKADELLAATEKLSKAVAVSQHHDAITGTEKQHVANDYHRRLDIGLSNLMEQIDSAYCPFLNISECAITDNDFDEITLVVYNPQAHTRSSIIHLPVKSDSGYVILDQDGNVIDHQVTPLHEQVKKIPGRNSSAEFDLAFIASNIPALQISAFDIRKSPVMNPNKKTAFKTFRGKKFKVSTNNEDFTITVNNESFSIFYEERKLSMTHQFGFYKGFPGHNFGSSDRASGAYIFRPLEQEPTILEITSSTLYTGPLFNELHLEYDNSASLVYRIPNNPQLYDAEYEWQVGPISVEDGVGKEFISRWRVNETFAQEGLFYTDSNGRQMMERRRNYRPSYDLLNASNEEPVSSNYYPINSAIYVRSEKDQMQLTVVNDRAQGGSSLHDGEIEIMLHRRLLYDDAFGVEEPLNEEAYGTGLVARGKHFVTLDTSFEDGIVKLRQLSNEIFGQVLYLFPNKAGPAPVKELFKPPKLSAYELPINVNLLTFEPWMNTSAPEAANQYLIRLEHLFEEGEDSQLSEPVTISLQELFGPTGLDIGQISFFKETTLGGNQWKDEKETLEWKIKGETMTVKKPKTAPGNDDIITLQPMEIRTFIVEFF